MPLFPTPLALVYFQVPYFTDAGNLNTLVATDGDCPDRVLLTWELTEGGVDSSRLESRPDNTLP